MRISLFLLLLSPSLIFAKCEDCDEVYAEIERETEIDSNYHACRTCRKVEPSMDNCPKFGFECSDKFGLSTNSLSATDDCQCLEARCADNAKLYVKTEFDEAPQTDPVNKIRCNNSEWMVDGAVVETAICAKGCNIDKCKDSVNVFSADFKKCSLIPASTITEECATALLRDNPTGFALLKPDGTLLKQLIGVDKLTCSGDGKWKYIDNGVKKEEKNVMCNQTPCGPSNCLANVLNTQPEDELIPITITGQGPDCARATCPGNAFVAVDAGSGTIIPHDFSGVGFIICTPGKKWYAGSGEFDGVMCKQLPCQGACVTDPLVIPGFESIVFTKPHRKNQCEYSCPDNMGLFIMDNTLWKPRSASSATCVRGKYEIRSTVPADRIGCYKCPLDDGLFPGLSNMNVDHCVFSCDEGYTIHYSDKAGASYTVDQLYVLMPNLNTPDEIEWFDADRNVPAQAMAIQCIKK